jgi:hypothetical protein
MANKAAPQNRKSSHPSPAPAKAKQDANAARDVPSEGQIAPLSSMIKGSYGVQGLSQLKETARRSSSVQRLIGVASEINQGAPAQLRGSAPPIQKLGANVNMVGEDDRFFETATGKTRLRVNPDADAYLEGLFERDSASSLTNASLGEKFSHAMNRVHKGIPYDKAKKIEAFDSHRQPVEGQVAPRRERGLGYMIHTDSATCWEKAAHFHLVLAELGITTFLEGGKSKADGEGHAWLYVPASEGAFGGKQVVIDPTVGKISNRTKYEGEYDITVPGKQVATPKVPESPKAVEKALKEFFDLEAMGGLVKKAVLDLVDMKIENALAKKKREKESAEWDKILLTFKQGLQ